MNSHLQTSKSGRTSLVLSSLALVVAVGGTGGPAIARAIAPNADKVDGFHAVGAGTKPGKRAGKLVATDATGRLPQNIIVPAMPGVLPAGATVRGAWGIDDEDPTQATSGDWGTTISFPVPLPDGMKLQVLGESEASAECSGFSFAPTAEPGWVCVYTVDGGLHSPPSGQLSTVYGAQIWVNDDTSEGAVNLTGTWAATAPR